MTAVTSNLFSKGMAEIEGIGVNFASDRSIPMEPTLIRSLPGSTCHLDPGFYLYLHRRLSTGELFYVGKGAGRRAYSRSSRNAHWRRIVAKDGGRIVEFVAQVDDEELAFLAEVEVIDKLRRLGCRLVNLTDGGEGPAGMKHSDETKAKFRARIASKEARQRMSESQLRYGSRPISAQAKAAALEWHKNNPGTFFGRVHSTEARAKMTLAWEQRRLTPMSEETKARIGETARGRTASAETRAKMSAARTGKKQSPESIAKRLETLSINKAKKGMQNG